MVTVKEWREYKEYLEVQNKKIIEQRNLDQEMYMKNSYTEHRFLWWHWKSRDPWALAPFFLPLIQPTVEGCLNYLAEKE